MMFGKGSCREAECIVSYAENAISGKKTACPNSDYPIHKRIKEVFDILLENEEKMSAAASGIIETVIAISSFDVGMSHISKQLNSFAEEIALLSQSNLAVVQQTTASMNQVSESIDNSTATLEELADNSVVLAKKNDESVGLLMEVYNLKEDVVRDTNSMNEKIQSLVHLANEVGKIVESVQGIANQTNLLALNAAIEAARAGEHGLGFAVVADEVRSLADDTKKNLAGMSEFMEHIHEAANESRSSLERTIDSTTQMSGKIDHVTKTVKENIEMLKSVTKGVEEVKDSSLDIKTAAGEINSAMEVSSEEAEKLMNMTAAIAEEAAESVAVAKQISKIDDDLGEIVRSMYMGVNNSSHALSNHDIQKIILNAKKAHMEWLKKLEKMVKEMHIYPLQLNSKKCAFGHYYHAIDIRNPEVEKLWNSIENLHNTFHGTGGRVIAAINDHNKELAEKSYKDAVGLSDKLIALLDEINGKLEIMIKENRSIFQK